MTPSPAALKDWNECRAHEAYQAACEEYCTDVLTDTSGEPTSLQWALVQEKYHVWQRELAA